MDYNQYNIINTFKECAGKCCRNQGTIKLKIKYIKKSGLFCKSCVLELRSLDLIDEHDIGVSKEK